MSIRNSQLVLLFTLLQLDTTNICIDMSDMNQILEVHGMLASARIEAS